MTFRIGLGRRCLRGCSRGDRNIALKTLGNLAQLRSKLNTAVRDYAWAKKKTGGPGKDGLDRFAHGLETFDDWLKCEEWNEEVIRERGEWLYGEAVKVWVAG